MPVFHVIFYLFLPKSVEGKAFKEEPYLLWAKYSTDSNVNWAQTTDFNLTTLFCQREQFCVNVETKMKLTFLSSKTQGYQGLHTGKECVIKSQCHIGYLEVDLGSHRKTRKFLVWVI